MLALLADDLTGALDAAAPFACRGLHVEVVLSIEAVSQVVREKPDVLAVNLASREIDAVTARERSAAVLAALPSATRLFKKVDSRLKGHIADELGALTFQRALVAPAIPEFGRTVKDGFVLGFGVDRPISIAERLGLLAGDVLVPDTLTQADMDRALDIPEIDLLVGARGLTEALANRMSGAGALNSAELPGGPCLFVVGSHDPITLAQIEALRAVAGLRYLAAPNGELADVRPDENLLTLVQAVPGEAVVSGQEVSAALADGVCPDFIQHASTLVLSGGATAEAVLERMGVRRFRLAGECLPGLGLAQVDGKCIITKSGGFGGPETLVQIADKILCKTV